MNSHILKRGILPHHRFADQFGSYVIGLDELAEFLGSGGEEIFVDKSQILSSRMLVGSRKLEQKLQDRIIEPLIFARAEEYVDFMRNEMKSRHSDTDENLRNDIKECPGGLRDIEMLLLMYKTKHRVRDPLSRKFLRRLVETERQCADEFRYVEDHLNFIKKLRDLYRLKVAAHNVIDRECMPAVAPTMVYENSAEAADRLFDEFLERTKEAAEVIDKLVERIDL
jgi:UTP:GlnB (protein PII) uridylyltransferase